MSRILKSLLRKGLDLLEQPDWADIRETADLLRRKIRGKDRTLRYVLTFAAGVGVGLGVGILTAPASGAQNRRAIAGKVREAGNRIKTRTAVEGDFATGTSG